MEGGPPQFARAGEHVTLSADGIVATKTSGGSGLNSVALLAETAGVASLEIKLDAGTYACIGVCKAGVDVVSTNNLYAGSDAWCMSAFSGGLYGNGKINAGGAGTAGNFAVGDRLGWRLDLGAGTLSFWKNGAPHGAMHTGIVGPVRGFVELFARGDSVSICPRPLFEPVPAGAAAAATNQEQQHTAEEQSMEGGPPQFARAGRHVTLSADGIVATLTSKGRGRSSVALLGEMGDGASFEIVLVAGKYVWFGVCKAGVDVASTNFLYRGSDAWCMGANSGSLWGNGKRGADAAEGFAVGDRLGWRLDLGAGTLSFWKNGAPHGAMLSGVVGPVRGFVELCARGDSVSICAHPMTNFC
eukprot:g4294.t1